jgi:hypothetical protein
MKKLTIFGIIIGLVGITGIWYYSCWQMSLCLFLLFMSNNISQHLSKAQLEQNKEFFPLNPVVGDICYRNNGDSYKFSTDRCWVLITVKMDFKK